VPVRTTSFSAIVRDSARSAMRLSVLDVTGRDVDAGIEREPSPMEEAVPDLASDMHAFARGADAGTLLHEVLEKVDLSRIDEAYLRELARQAIDRNALDPACEDQIVHVVDSVSRTPLRTHPEPFRLADLASGRLLPEMEFTLAAAVGDSGPGLSGVELGRLLRRSSAGSPLARYADRATRLGWRELDGFLRGFIDAVFHDGERYYLIDYKSNHLGVRQADYMPERLVEPMIEHDYVLQYLIYAIALDRHLCRSVESYDYERHFGGVYYLFLRGLAESHAPGCGVFFDRPEMELVRGASDLLGGVREVEA
jgi:exodeoxyribonuclease V beta subunit